MTVSQVAKTWSRRKRAASWQSWNLFSALPIHSTSSIWCVGVLSSVGLELQCECGELVESSLRLGCCNTETTIFTHSDAPVAPLHELLGRRCSLLKKKIDDSVHAGRAASCCPLLHRQAHNTATRRSITRTSLATCVTCCTGSVLSMPATLRALVARSRRARSLVVLWVGGSCFVCSSFQGDRAPHAPAEDAFQGDPAPHAPAEDAFQGDRAPHAPTEDAIVVALHHYHHLLRRQSTAPHHHSSMSLNIHALRCPAIVRQLPTRSLLSGPAARPAISGGVAEAAIHQLAARAALVLLLARRGAQVACCRVWSAQLLMAPPTNHWYGMVVPPFHGRGRLHRAYYHASIQLST